MSSAICLLRRGLSQLPTDQRWRCRAVGFAVRRRQIPRRLGLGSVARSGLGDAEPGRAAREGARARDWTIPCLTWATPSNSDQTPSSAAGRGFSWSDSSKARGWLGRHGRGFVEAGLVGLRLGLRG